MSQLVPVEQAVETVLAHIKPMPTEAVPLLEAAGRVAAADLASDIDVAPFDQVCMDGFGVRAQQLGQASKQTPVELEVVADIGAGTVFEGSLADGQCLRIMTGAPAPSGIDAVVKYEVVDVMQGDGKAGSRVAFTAPVEVGSNIRPAGEDAQAGACVVAAGEVIKSAGVGFLAGCGVTEVVTYRRPRVAIICTGSELVPCDELPGPGKIRNSNGPALAACVHEAGGLAEVLPVVEDTFEALEQAVLGAVPSYDFVITTGGAANGDYDFIRAVAAKLGQVYVTDVNMRPGKAQTFALVDGVPLFGLSGNPAAAYIGFQMLVRPALRKVQGHTQLQRPRLKARLAVDVPKRDPRRIYLRATLDKDEHGYVATPAKNQSSGLFGVLQRANCLAVMPEGLESKKAGEMLDCVMLDVDEGVVL